MIKEHEKFLLKEDKARGTYTMAWFAGTGFYFEDYQLVPDTFFDENNEKAAAWSRNDKRHSHFQPIASIPTRLKDNWCKEFGVNNIHEDEDVKKKILQRLDSNEFRKLRTSGGQIL